MLVDIDVRMTTRDGVSLASDVYRPAHGDPVPALLHRTPYDRTDPTLVSSIVADPVALARRGYAVVVQDVRGRGGSGGEMDFFHQEQADGYDAVEWAAAQPWCDGNVGIYGSSYHAMTTFQALAARPPHLRAAVAMIGATDLRATTHPGGLFELGFLTLYGLGQSLDAVARQNWPAGEMAAFLARVRDAAADPLATVTSLPVSGIDPLAEVPFWRDWIDGDRVTAPTLRERPDLVGVPLLQVVGFRDFMAPTMLELFRSLEGPEHRLIAGPWAHSGTYDGHVGSRRYPAAPGGVGAWGPVITGWFDRHLKGREPTPDRFLGPGRVTFYLSGDDGWNTADLWPPPGTPTVLPLGSDGALGGEPGTRTYRSDPHDPFPTCGGASSGAALGPDGVQDRRVVEARSDLLMWTSEPLAEPLRMAGPVTLVVHLESTAPGVDVCATLVDVEPDGFAAGICEGAQRVRLRPGEITEVTVALHDTAHTFRPGHRLRLEVAGANFPRLSRNLHTGEVPEHGAEAVVAVQTIHRAPTHPSRLILPTPHR